MEIFVAGIYILLNTANDRRYVGSSVNAVRRIKTHIQALRRGNHFNPHLQSAWKKYGEATFQSEIVEVVTDLLTLKYREQAHLVRWMPNVYNLAKDVIRPGVGIQQTADTKRKISAANKGRKLSESRRKEMLSYVTGRKQSVESKAKRSMSMKGKNTGPKSDAAKELMRKAKLGKPLSEAHRAKLRAIHRGDEHRAKLRAAWVIRKDRGATLRAIV